MESIKPTVIEKKKEEHTPSDFNFLRQKGIEFLQNLSGETWTDYNTHDPGITILEQVCFAVTDLAYRTNFPIEDLLTDPQGNINREDNAFFNKEQILTSNPITVNDFRKSILDEVEELDNVWLKPVKSKHAHYFAKGLYKIIVQVNKHTANAILKQEIPEEEVIEKVRASFLSKRNLCEDGVREIIVLKAQKIHIQSEIIIKEHAIPEEVLAEIYNALETELNPSIRRYTEIELRNKGLPVEDIYSGPILKRGFIREAELKRLKKNIDPSELIKVISQVKGVLYVKNLSINSTDKQVMGKPFTLNENSFALLTVDPSNLGIKLLNNKYQVLIKKPVFEVIFKKLRGLSKQIITNELNATESKTIPKGRYRNINEYYSIQNYFPLIYGIGEEGVSESEGEDKKGKVLQLKAYLLFFEQILANYLSQLSNIGDLFSPNLYEKKAYTYFFQSLYDVPGVKELLKPYTDNPSFYKNWDQFKEDSQNGYMAILKNSQETTEIYRKRKNTFLDHLLARFNKKAATYPVQLYYLTYGNRNEESKINPELKWKAELLQNIPALFYDGIKAFNYTKEYAEISGFEKKISFLLYIQNTQKRALTTVFDTGSIALVSEKEQTSSHPTDENASITKVSWEGEHLTLFIGADELIQLTEMGKLIAGGINQNEAFIFRYQRQNILVNGININNYRIGPDTTDQSRFVIIYKNPDEEIWKSISRHATKTAAIKALERLIAYLKKISIQSEGFHVMEHILLRPELKQKSFGFKFHQVKNKVILENDNFFSFNEREKVINKLIASAQTSGNTQNSSAVPANKFSFRINRFNQQGSIVLQSTEEIHQGQIYDAEQEFKNVIVNLIDFKTNKTRFFPHFEMFVKLSDSTLLKEDFFNYRMTVVLPKWPARFQNQDFKVFAEDLFTANVPANVRIKFMWLTISEMKKFETLYFDWLTMFKNKTTYYTRNKISEKLIHFLKDDTYVIEPNVP